MLDPRLNSIFESILDSQIWGPRPCPGHCATMSRNPACKRDHIPEDNHDIRDHVPWDDLQAATISRGIRIGPCRHERMECGNRIATGVVIMSCGRNRDISRRRCLWRMDLVPCATMSRGIKSDKVEARGAARPAGDGRTAGRFCRGSCRAVRYRVLRMRMRMRRWRRDRGVS